MVGIGGSGMSGLAEILLNLGYKVSGSDLDETRITARLKSLGIKIFKGHASSNIKGAGIIVYSAAIGTNNVEIKAAKKNKIPLMNRGKVLADIMRLKPRSVAVAGTHGKTTTTSMINSVFEAASKDATSIIGGVLNRTGANAKWGKGGCIIVETDEHDGSFLILSPTVGVVTTLDEEHMDYYGTLDELKDAFLEFMLKIPFYGLLVVSYDDKNIRSLLDYIHCDSITYSCRESNADLIAKKISLNKDIDNMETTFRVINRSRFGKKGNLGIFNIKSLGVHNVSNALAAIGVGMGMGIEIEKIKKGLSRYAGVRRRMEIKKCTKKFLVIEDYAHHPVEVSATLKAVKPLVKGRLLVIFQPHLYSRTKYFFKEFAKVLSKADKVFLSDIYPAREKPIKGVSSRLIMNAMLKNSFKDVEYLKNKSEIVKKVVSVIKPGDTVLVLGAGDIYKVSNKLCKILK
jgi:UDP-N-acetylmuramate--alanine ligase